jgi:uncharacterized protein
VTGTRDAAAPSAVASRATENETVTMPGLPIVNIHESSEWPTPDVVSKALADPRWQPRPFAEFIVKMHGRCNLACDYCYMYEMADQSWRSKPVLMATTTIDQVASRLAEHLHAHAGELPEAHVKMHGGEALLVGAEQLAYAATAFRAAAPAGTAFRLSVQTNGVLLDNEEMLAVLREHDIRVGVSIDGGKEAHDRHRRYANGRGSFDAVLRGIDAVRPTGLLHILLCTINIENDPLEVYEALLTLGSPQIDFELPLGNWTEPPPGLAPGQGSTPYADWLIPIFDRWYGTTPVPANIRILENIMALVLGGHSHTEGLGLGPFQTLTIDTDGSVELVDTLKSAFEGAPVTGLNVFDHPFDDARLHPGVVARQLGLAGLSQTCLQCPIRTVCGGGQYAHRYRAGTGFLNPSVYCADLTKLIGHVSDRVLADVERLRAQVR